MFRLEYPFGVRQYVYVYVYNIEYCVIQWHYNMCIYVVFYKWAKCVTLDMYAIHVRFVCNSDATRTRYRWVVVPLSMYIHIHICAI